MAQYIKFRLTAAKVSVSMAFLALVAGLADRIGQPPAVTATPSAAKFLKLGGLGHAVRGNFLKLENKLLKLDSTLLKLEHKVNRSYYTKGQINFKFLKIDAANSRFLKIDTANSQFLKIDAANSQFLKMTDAGATYLKLRDAAAQYLKLDGTAANAAELGGQSPSSFVQGHANVVTGGILIGSDQPTPQPLLQTPDGKVTVAMSSNAEQVIFNLTNNTGVLLTAVLTEGGQTAGGPTEVTFKPGATTSIPLPSGVSNPNQLQLQVLPTAGYNQALTLTLSSVPAATRQVDVVGQMLIGLL